MAPAGDVTCRVVEPLVAGESEIADDKKVAVQPAGMLRVKSNVDAPQALESLLVTVTVNATIVPAWTPELCDGEMTMVGLALLHTAALATTLTTT